MRPPRTKVRRSIRMGTMLLIAALFSAPAVAGPLREALRERPKALRESGAASRIPLPPGARLLGDVAYAPDPEQRLDVYLPAEAKTAPIVLMVHGGGWRIGDKAHAPVVTNKIARWLPRGIAIVSVNYRMPKQPDPLEQADDVARALAFVQANAQTWGADPSRIVLMGHSAGGHLISMLASDPTIVTRNGAKPWLGSVPLDSAAFDLVTLMEAEHYRLFDEVFGQRRETWIANSPLHRLAQAPKPMLIVCSSRRDDACPQARTFAQKATSLGGRVTVLPVDRSHRGANDDLGPPGDYTAAVEAFLGTLGVP